MRKLLSVLAATVLVTAFAPPLSAAPIFVPKPEQMQSNAVEPVSHRRHWRHNHYRNWRGDYYGSRRYAWRSCRYYGNCYRPYYGYGSYYRPYYRPYYGYRNYYPGYYPRSGISLFFSF